MILEKENSSEDEDPATEKIVEKQVSGTREINTF